MKLIENTVLGLQCKAKEKEFKTRLEYLNWYEKIRNNYDVFLNQPLVLGMFVPCDEDGNVLEEPLFNYENEHDSTERHEHSIKLNKYQQSKEKVLFEGFESRNKGTYIGLYLKDKIIIKFWKDDLKAEMAYNYYQSSESVRIEDLVKHNLTLTQNAIKQFNL